MVLINAEKTTKMCNDINDNLSSTSKNVEIGEFVYLSDSDEVDKEIDDFFSEKKKSFQGVCNYNGESKGSLDVNSDIKLYKLHASHLPIVQVCALVRDVHFSPPCVGLLETICEESDGDSLNECTVLVFC